MLKRGLYIPELNQTLLILLKQSIEHNFEDSALEMMAFFVAKVDAEDVLDLIKLGLIVELGTMKKEFSEGEDEENLSKIILIGKEINERVRGMGLLSKGVYREL